MYTPREIKREQIEAHVAGVCVRIDEETQDSISLASKLQILVAKRNTRRELYPNLNEGCGGQLRPNETFMQGLQRHYEGELGLKVDVLPAFHRIYHINTGSIIIPGVRFLCKWISGEARSNQHSKVFWMPWTEFTTAHANDFIPGLKKDSESLIHAWLSGESQKSLP